MFSVSRSPLARAAAAKLALLRKYGAAWPALRRGLGLLLRGKFGEIGRKLRNGLDGPRFDPPPGYDPDRAYADWRRRRALTEGDRDRLRAEAAKMTDGPLVTVVVGAGDALQRTIDSLEQQFYPRWELRVTAPGDLALALAAARGTFVTMLEAGDTLDERALLSVVRTIAADPSLDLVYTDEDHIDAAGQQTRPFFKPDWSPEYQSACPYVGGLAVYRTHLVRERGGAQSPDELMARFAAQSPRVAHIADVLYHRGRDVEQQARGVRSTIIGRPRVSILIPTAAVRQRIDERDAVMVVDCVRSIRQQTTWPEYEVLILGDETMPTAVREELSRLGCVVFSCSGPFNFSAKINFGAERAAGSHLLLLNDDTQVMDPDWIRAMLEYSQQQNIGAVGAKLLFPSGRLQHVGISLLRGEPIHTYYGFPSDTLGHGNAAVVPRNCSAVTAACLMTRTDVFRSVGGFDTAFPLDYNDVDYCLKVRAEGKRVVFTPHARLIHYEAVSRAGRWGRGRELFRARWGKLIERDPYFNPNLCTDFPDYRIDPEAASR